MNVFTFTGNLGRDAEVRHTQSGTTVCSFSVAVKSGYGDREKTSWIRCNLWGKRAESGLPQYLTKGQQVAVSGELTVSEYEAQDGTKRTNVEVRVNDVSLIGGSGAPAAQPPQNQSHQGDSDPYGGFYGDNEAF